MKVRDEINKFSREEDKPILLWLLARYSLESQFKFVAYCKKERYGNLSYEVNRVWYPTEEGIVLYNHLKED